MAPPPPSEAEETVHAIHYGDVDAVVVQRPEGPQIIMLQGVDEPYYVLVERMSDGALTLDRDGSILYVNARLAELTGAPVDRLIGRDFAALFSGAPPSLRATADEALLARPDGEPRPVSVWARQMSIGGVAGTLVTITDLSVHRRAERIAHAERFARSILEQATDSVVVMGRDGVITHASAKAEQLASQPPVGRRFSEAFPLDGAAGASGRAPKRFASENLDTLLASKPFHGVEVRLRAAAHGSRSFLLSAGPLLDDAQEQVGSIVTLTEITERKRAEEQQTMLVAELNHRVKNILAIVQSVAAQTVRSAGSLSNFTDAFSGRLQALSVAHDILTQTRWIGVGLNELVEKLIAPYRAGGDRITVQGPAVLLSARAVLPLSMVLHELTTNAAKYGGLSAPGGRIEISWTVSGGERRQVELVWSESGGPPVSKPSSSGFGTALVDRVIKYDLDGRSTIAFDPAGLRCTIAFPIATIGISPMDLPSSALPA
jgi:two-component sensor histidine kinase/PAS domain-containing protein